MQVSNKQDRRRTKEIAGSSSDRGRWKRGAGPFDGGDILLMELCSLKLGPWLDSCQPEQNTPPSTLHSVTGLRFYLPSSIQLLSSKKRISCYPSKIIHLLFNCSTLIENVSKNMVQILIIWLNLYFYHINGQVCWKIVYQDIYSEQILENWN